MDTEAISSKSQTTANTNANRNAKVHARKQEQNM